MMALHLDLYQIFFYFMLWDKSEEVVTKPPWIYTLIYVFTKLPWYLKYFICLVQFGNWRSYVINKVDAISIQIRSHVFLIMLMSDISLTLINLCFWGYFFLWEFNWDHSTLYFNKNLSNINVTLYNC